MFLVRDLSPTLNTWTRDEIFQQYIKYDFFKHILKKLANKYESTGSNTFRNMTKNNNDLSNHHGN